MCVLEGLVLASGPCPSPESKWQQGPLLFNKSGPSPECMIWGALPWRGRLMPPGDAAPPLGQRPCAKTRHVEKTDEGHQRCLEEEEWGLNTGQGLFGVSQPIGTMFTWLLKNNQRKKSPNLKVTLLSWVLTFLPGYHTVLWL